MINTPRGLYLLETDEEKRIFEEARNISGSASELIRRLGYNCFKNRGYGIKFNRILNAREPISQEKWEIVKEIYNGK